MNNDTAIRAVNVHKNYGPIAALDGLNLSLPYGQIVGLLGENGCGKTTLLKILAGLMYDYSGDVEIAGFTPGTESKAHVAFLPDADFLPRSATVISLISYFNDFFTDFDTEKANDLIGFFGLDKQMKLNQMSKGMGEKVQIALTLARNAKVFLLDEPISGVDPAARQVIMDGILRGISDDSLVLISTHLIHDLEPVLDAVVMMRYGKTLLADQVDNLRAEHQKSIDQIFREVYSWSQH